MMTLTFVAYFKILSRHCLGETEVKQEISLSRGSNRLPRENNCTRIVSQVS